MLEKYDEFLNRDKNLKIKEKEIKKQKMKLKLDKVRKKKNDAQKAFNQFVAGASNYNSKF